MNNKAAWEFARNEMLEESEALLRAEPVGPFVVALVELAGGGYENRAAQPAVVLRNRASKLPAVVRLSTHGRSQRSYRAASLRFNSIIDEELA